MCLNSECLFFWILPSGLAPSDTELNYDPRFLKQKTIWSSEIPPYDLRPALPQPAARMGADVTYAMTRGMCCPECGKCTSRYRWKGWSCSNNDCGFEHMPVHPLITAESIRDPWHPVSAGYSLSQDWAERSTVTTSTEFSHNFRIVRYQIKGVEGHISHMISNRTVNEELQGPDQMFKELQLLDANLERRPFASGREGYMTAFSSNCGMPYKFAASIDSMSFEVAPWPLSETRSRLDWAARLVLGSAFAKQDEFNELLTIGYFDGQNIKYHDDGERGLGSTVASLSLGASADMLFRVKSKHFSGVSKSGCFTDKAPIPGTRDFEARRAAYDDLQTDQFVDNQDRKDRLRQLAEELGLKDVCKDRKPWIRLRLSHGDIVVMHGQAIQEYMEHQVESIASLRFALTCRTILADHLKPDEMPAYEVKPDERLYDGSGIAEMRA